jgi:hypothetical protein
MGMERSLMRLMRSQAQAWRASSSSQVGLGGIRNGIDMCLVMVGGGV